MKQIFAVAFCISILVSCQQNDSQRDRISKISMPARADYEESVEVAPVEAAATEALTVTNAPQSNAAIEQKIIREAMLRFPTDDMDETYRQIVDSGKKYNAQIQTDSETKEYSSISRQLTVRIPNQHFDAFLADVGKGVSFFDQKEITSTDVTEEYIDIDARLNAKKKLEARYLELLGRAGKVSEMLEIEKQLAIVREEIEAKEGRLRYMKNRIALSTVSIVFYKQIATEGGAKVSYGTKLWNAIATGFNSILLFFVEVLNNWPLILILVVLIFWLFRKFRKRKKP